MVASVTASDEISAVVGAVSSFLEQAAALMERAAIVTSNNVFFIIESLLFLSPKQLVPGKGASLDDFD